MYTKLVLLSVMTGVCCFYAVAQEPTKPKPQLKQSPIPKAEPKQLGKVIPPKPEPSPKPQPIPAPKPKTQPKPNPKPSPIPDTKPKPQPNPTPKTRPGRIDVDIDIDVRGWRKLPKPQDNPPKNPPPKKDGGDWRWHRHYGWCWIPVAYLTRSIILPVDYTFPRRAVVYERRVVYVTCPSCGETLMVELE